MDYQVYSILSATLGLVSVWAKSSMTPNLGRHCYPQQCT